MFTEDYTGHVLPEIYMNNNPLQPVISGESPSILPKLETTMETSKVWPGKELLCEKNVKRLKDSFTVTLQKGIFILKTPCQSANSVVKAS